MKKKPQYHVEPGVVPAGTWWISDRHGKLVAQVLTRGLAKRICRLLNTSPQKGRR